jgi:hypothetical protein
VATGIAQGAVFIALLYAAARFEARDFALYGLAFGLANMANSANTFGVETRLAVVRDDGVAALVRVGGTAAVAVSGLALPAVVLLVLMGDFDVSVSVALAIGAGHLMAWQQMLTVLALRHAPPHALSRSRTAQGLTNAALIFGLGATPLPGYVVLTGAWVVSILVGLRLLATVVPPAVRTWRPATRSDWAFAVDQVRYQPLSNLLVGLAAQAPLVLLPVVTTDAVAGAWALCTRLLSAVVVAGQAVLQPIYYAEAAEHVRQRRWGQLRRWHALWAIGLGAGAGVLFSLAGWIISSLLPRLDPQWASVGTVVIAGCIYWGSMLWSVPLSQTLQLMGAMGWQFAWAMVRLAVAGGSFVATSSLGGSTALWAWAVLCLLTDALLITIQLLILARRSRRSEPSPDVELARAEHV